MVEKLNIGVVGIQGAVSEHIYAMQQALKNKNISGTVFEIRDKDDIKKIDGLILPGGESTTISKVLVKSGIFEQIQNRIQKNNLPIMGTCAGCAILSSKIADDTKDVKILKAVDMQVRRNAFGRQKHSFEKEIKIEELNGPFNAVFIRAPAIEKIWGDCKALAKVDEKIVMVKQKNIIALSFHPELTDDFRIHQYFLDIIV